MAKVTLILEDAVGDDGEAGMIVDLTIDPPIEKGQKETLAQNWANGIVDMIMSASSDIRFDTETSPLPDTGEQKH